jgi:hypothetical protein
VRAQLAITVCHRLERAGEHLRFALAVTRAIPEGDIEGGRIKVIMTIKAALAEINPALDKIMVTISNLMREEASE